MKTTSRSMGTGWIVRLALLLVAGASGMALGADFSSWEKRMPIQFTGYDRGETLANFPALVVFSNGMASGFAYADFLSGNADLRFTDSSQTNELNYEIEKWDTGGSSYVWVQVPQLESHATIYAFWGKSGETSPDCTTNGATWSNGCVAVWHMEQKNATDATKRGHNGTAQGAITTVNGKIGNGNSLTPNADYIVVPASADLTLNGDYSMSMWVYPRSHPDYEGLIGNYSTTDSFIFALYTGQPHMLSFYSPTPGWTLTTNIVSEAEWHHVGYTRQGTENKFYIDGVHVMTFAKGVALSGSGNNLHIGNGGPSWTGYGADGILDEVRIESVKRSPDWIWASYINQASNQVFATNWPVQLSSVPSLLSRVASDITANSATLNGTLFSTGQAPVIVAAVYWGTNDGGTVAANWGHTNMFSPPPQAAGPLTTNIVGLSSNTLYYYRFYTTNSLGGTWADPPDPPGTFITGELTVRATDTAASEAGPNVGAFTISRPAWSTGAALTVTYSLAGSADNGVDYATLSGETTFPVGATDKTVTVTPIYDGLTEGPETVLLTLNGGGGIPGTPAEATVTIQDGANGSATDLTWRGTSNDLWSVGTNWVGDVAPGNPTANVPTFGNTDLGGTNVVDPESLAVPIDTWTVSGGLKYNNTTAGKHTTVIGSGKTLAVNGPVYTWVNIGVDHSAYSGLAATIMGDGALRIGAEGDPKDLRIAQITGANWRGISGTLKIALAGGLETYLNTVVLGSSDEYRNEVRPLYGYLDLRGTPLVGGAFRAANLAIGYGAQHQGYVNMDAICNLTNLIVTGTLQIGIWGSTGRLGDSANGWKLPANVRVQLGVSPSARGTLTLGTAGISQNWNGGYTGNGQLLGATNGTLTAYLTSATVGYSTFNYSPAVGSGVLDMSAMTNVAMDVSGTVTIGESTTVNGRYTATVKLPAGTVAANALRMGIGGTGTRSALLELNGTRFTVAQSATLGAVATLKTTVNGKSAGLVITNSLSSALDISTGGKIDVVFAVDQSGSETGPYYGLAWQGNHVSRLYTENTAGRLTWSNAVAGKTVGVIYDAGTGYTYVTIRASWPPTAVAKNISRPVFSETQQVVVTAADMDGGSFDPNDRAIIATNISCTADLTPTEAYVTLAGVGVYNVTLEIENEDHETATDVGTVTLAIPPATGGDVIWNGGAENGMQWIYGANWVGGIAPTNPTTGILSFDAFGLVGSATTNVTSIVDPKESFGYADTWSVSGLRFVNTAAGSHNLRIEPDSTLLVTNHLYAWRDAGADHQQYSNLRVRFTGGTLQLGTPQQAVDLSVAIVTGGSNWRGTEGQMVVTNTAGFLGYTRDIYVGYIERENANWNVQGSLDLRGTPILDGTLRARTLALGRGYNGYGRIYLDDACGLTNLTVSGNLLVASASSSGESYIGSPATKALPAGVEIHLGVDAGTRCAVDIGIGATYAADGTIKGSGASVSGWLSRLRVGVTGSGQKATGTFDMGGMTNVDLDISGNLEVGNSASGPYTAVVKFPAGQVVAANLYVGVGGSGVRSGLLELNGTQVVVAQTSQIGAAGTINVTLNGLSAGISLADSDANALDIAVGGKLNIVFSSDSLSIVSDPYYALCWPGNHVTTLRDMITDGRITVDGSVLIRPYSVFLYDDATYIGVRPILGSLFRMR